MTGASPELWRITLNFSCQPVRVTRSERVRRRGLRAQDELVLTELAQKGRLRTSLALLCCVELLERVRLGRVGRRGPLLLGRKHGCEGVIAEDEGLVRINWSGGPRRMRVNALRWGGVRRCEGRTRIRGEGGGTLARAIFLTPATIYHQPSRPSNLFLFALPLLHLLSLPRIPSLGRRSQAQPPALPHHRNTNTNARRRADETRSKSRTPDHRSVKPQSSASGVKKEREMRAQTVSRTQNCSAAFDF